MADFKPKPGTKSAYRTIKKPIADIGQFNDIIQALIMSNPLGCTSYLTARKNYRPILKVREQYTAKFAYLNADKKRIGTGLDMYDSVEGYQTGIAAVISNVANSMSHRGTARHLPDADLFSVTLKCHDAGGELYYLSIGRNRITVSSYNDDAIRKKVEAWADTVPALV